MLTKYGFNFETKISLQRGHVLIVEYIPITMSFMKMNWFAQAKIASFSLHRSLGCIYSALFRVRTNFKYKRERKLYEEYTRKLSH